MSARPEWPALRNADVWQAGAEFRPGRHGHLSSVIPVSCRGFVIAHVNALAPEHTAALIAAAPELLRLLDEYQEAVANLADAGHVNELAARAAALIAEARGFPKEVQP